MRPYRGFFCLAAGITLLAAESGAGTPVQKMKVTLKVPDSGWKIAIEEVYRVKDELWAISRVSHRPGMAMQVISTVSDEVSVAAPAWPVRHFIVGKTWGWQNDEPYRFLHGLDEIAALLKGGKRLYPADAHGLK